MGEQFRGVLPKPRTLMEDRIQSLCLIILVLFIVVITLRVSLFLMPPKKLDTQWTSRSTTGWTNTPKKLSWANTVEKVAEGNK